MDDQHGTKLVNLDTKLDDHDTKLDDLDTKLDTHDVTIDNLQKDFLFELKMLREQMNTQRDEMSNQINILNKENQQLKSSLTQQTQEIAVLKERLAQTDKEWSLVSQSSNKWDLPF